RGDGRSDARGAVAVAVGGGRSEIDLSTAAALAPRDGGAPRLPARRVITVDGRDLTVSERPAGSPTVAITGAAGFLGSHLCDHFLARGWHVVGVDNLLTGVAGNLAHLEGNGSFLFLRRDVAKLFTVDGPIDLVLHFASPASPRDYLRYPIQTLEVDSVGTVNALALAEAHRARFVLASTSEVYG